MSDTFIGADGLRRCAWCRATAAYQAYHDTEWGFPVSDDRLLFEKLSLECFQSGLSWRTILEKREGFRAAFANFEIEKVAHFGAPDVERLLQDKGIVRHRGKIEAVIGNARCAQTLIAEEGSLAAYFWSFEPEDRAALRVPPVSSTPVSAAISKSLKSKGWKFVGPTTVYSFMQAMGLVNDHAEECWVREKVEEARARFAPPRRLT
ncbi:MAG: DNA-3-methyladenine glycosylase I [Pseudomonadota bacterium]